jgi:integrase
MRRLRRSTARSLRQLAEAGAVKPFGFVHRGTLYHHLENLLRAAGLPTDRRHKFHCLRRTHASYLKRAGGDARESLDHQSDETTRRYYFDPRVCGAQNVLAFLFHPFSLFDRLLMWLGLCVNVVVSM